MSYVIITADSLISAGVARCMVYGLPNGNTDNFFTVACATRGFAPTADQLSLFPHCRP